MSLKVCGAPKSKPGSGMSWTLSLKIYGVSKPKTISGRFFILFPKFYGAPNPKIHPWGVLDLVPEGFWCLQSQTWPWEILDPKKIGELGVSGIVLVPLLLCREFHRKDVPKAPEELGWNRILCVGDGSTCGYGEIPSQRPKPPERSREFYPGLSQILVLKVDPAPVGLE